MALVKVVINGEDLTDGKGIYIDMNKIKEMENEGFRIELM